MGDFKMDGYEPMKDETFEMMMHMSIKRTEVLKYYIDLKASFNDRFDDKAFAKAMVFLDMGTMLMEKALFVEEEG